VQLFLDTANVEEIKRAYALGVVSGVTTNPSLIAREGRDFAGVLREITAVVDGPVSAEAVSLDAEGMVAEGLALAAIHPNIVVKITMTPAGMQAVKLLAGQGVKTNVTLTFSANQALLAALAGASYVSPFVGRLDDTGYDGSALITEIIGLYRNYGYQTRVIAASIRHPLHVLAAARAGAHIATVPYRVLLAMFEHPLTKKGIERFLADWATVPKPEKPQAGEHN